MSFSFGRLPDFFAMLRDGSRGRAPCVFALLVFASAAADAERALPLTLAEAEAMALAAEPGREAILASGEAFEQRAVAAGALPAPSLRTGVNNFPLESGGFTTEGMTNAGISYRQAFPPGRSRSLARERFERLADEMDDSAAARARNVRVAVRHAWLDLYFAERAHALVLESRPFFEELAGVTSSLYGVGEKSQQDVMRAQLELSRLDDRLIDVEQRRADARAALAEWIGADAARPVADKLPPWDAIPALEALEAGLAAHPALGALDYRLAAEEAAVAVADEASKPGWAVDVGYAYRDGRLPDGRSRSDFISVNVTVGLPMLRAKSLDSELSAALADRRATAAEKEQLERRLQSRLSGAYARWHDLTRRIELFDERVLRHADGYADAAVIAYRNNRADFADVMRGYIDQLDVRIERERLEVERARTYATLADLGGLEP